jgi:hypothetical protein
MRDMNSVTVTFLRGGYATNSEGMVEFITTYPGFCEIPLSFPRTHAHLSISQIPVVLYTFTQWSRPTIRSRPMERLSAKPATYITSVSSSSTMPSTMRSYPKGFIRTLLRDGCTITRMACWAVRVPTVTMQLLRRFVYLINLSGTYTCL